MKSKIAPSMMCADFFNLADCVRTFEQEQIEYLHIDIMDGHFVPNFTLGTDYVRMLKEKTAIPLDLHLMIEKPEEALDRFAFGEGDYVSVHAESTCHLHRALAAIRARGARPMAAINPATPVCLLENVLDDVDGVLVMTVNPGFAGQKLVPATLRKIADLRRNTRLEIEVDGNVSFENAVQMRAAGAGIFVGGTSSVFSKSGTLTENIRRLRACIK